MCGSGEYTLTPSKHNKKKKESILFVDDDHDTAYLSKTVLERNGFEVVTFESPVSTLENFKPGSYDLLLVDIKMRDMMVSNFMIKYEKWITTLGLVL